MNMPSQNQRLMIARLILHSWYPRRYDKKASKQIAELNGAASAEEVGRFNKILVELASIQPLQSRISKLRSDHYRFTAPWTDKGERVLPVELYFEYTEMVRDSIREISDLADDFAFNEYAKQRGIAVTRLGSLFNSDDYPAEIRTRFGVEYKFEPLPNPEDVRVWGIGQQAAEQIELELRSTIEETMQESQQHVVDQVLTRCTEFVEKVKRYDEGATNRLYDSALENLRDVTALVLKGLNITGDAQLYRAAEMLNDQIAGLQTSELKEEASLRVSKRHEVEATMKRFAGVFGSPA